MYASVAVGPRELAAAWYPSVEAGFPMIGVHAQSESYTVRSEYELVFLSGVGVTDERVIGDFYGDPVCAIIDRNESWCVMGGCGLVVYWLCPPFEPYRYAAATSQWSEFGRYRPDTWWVERLEQRDEDHVIFDVSENDPHAGRWALNVSTMVVTPIAWAR
jgi:hypothetical protein